MDGLGIICTQQVALEIELKEFCVKEMKGIPRVDVITVRLITIETSALIFALRWLETDFLENSLEQLSRKWAQLLTTSRCCRAWLKPVNDVVDRQA